MKRLTIILVINKLSNYFNLTLSSILNQTCKDFDFAIIDKYHLSNFEDAIYYKNENEAIYYSKTDLIYFMSNLDILRLNFVSNINQWYKPVIDIYWFAKVQSKKPYKRSCKVRSIPDNLFETNSINDKVYKRKFLIDKHIGFNLSYYHYNINHIMFNYKTLFETDNRKFYSSGLVLHLSDEFDNYNYYLSAYKEMIEELKVDCFLTDRPFNKDLKRCLIMEDMRIRNEGFK